MFKIMKDNKIVGVSENKPVLLDNYEVQEDNEHSVSDYTQINSEYVLTSSDEAIEQKKAEVRSVRNQYLEQTDKYMITDYPITDDERELYKQYREYLRIYTEANLWYESNPFTFDEWKKLTRVTDTEDLYEQKPMTFEEWKSLQTTNNNDVSME